ncbi:MAG: M48 family metallopeptidase [Planctomycetes bacterium]|nr:M48 family metallopeptidase [Planctomycetota bacterium]MCB9904619.1 M48 family metallopeptidase [Planctomycetota bacterium]
MSRVLPYRHEGVATAPRAVASSRTSYATRSRARRFFRWCASLVLASSLTGCGALQLYTPEDDMQLGLQAYDEIVGEEPLITSGPQYDMVQRATGRLVEAAKRMGPEFTQRFEWEVRLIDNPDVVNAFCLPGGKMAVYTGILPVAQTETGLAVVMGHEIAHATERHGTERMSRAQLEELVVQAGVTAAGGDELHAEAARGALQLAVNLPFSRRDELEADQVGLLYMAAAGYDPREAERFWGRMSALSGGGGSSLEAFLSTHPTDQDRIAQIRELLPEAMRLYEASEAVGNP